MSLSAHKSGRIVSVRVYMQNVVYECSLEEVADPFLRTTSGG